MSQPRRNLSAALLFAASLVGCAGGSAPPNELPSPAAVRGSRRWDPDFLPDLQANAGRIMDRLDLAPGVRVADLEALDGVLTERLAVALGPASTIYAEEGDGGWFGLLSQRITGDGLPWVQLVRGTPADPRLPPNSIDLALVGHGYHALEDPAGFLRGVSAALGSGGRLAVVDRDRPGSALGTTPARLRCELAALGYRESGLTRLFPGDLYLAVFTAPASPPAAAAASNCSDAGVP